MTDILTLMQNVDYIYEPVPVVSSDEKYTVWLKDGKWLLTKYKNDDKILIGTTDPEGFLVFMKGLNLDMYLFEAHLIHTIATKGVLRRMQAKKIEELVGKDVVDNMEKSFDEISKEIKEILNDINKPKLEVVKGGK